MNKRKAASSVEGAAFLSFRGIIFHHTSCASGRLPYVGVNDWPQPVHGTMTSIVPYKLFAAFAAIGKVSPRRDEGIPPYRLPALPAAYYKKLCRERLIPVQEPNQRSGWPLKFDCGRSDLPYIFRITLPAKNLSPFYPIRTEKYVDKPRFIWYIIQAIFCVHGPLVKRLRQRPLTPLTWVRFPHGSPGRAL